MGDVKNFVPKSGLAAKAFLQSFLREFGDNVVSVAIVGVGRDGYIIDGWSAEAAKDVVLALGAIEQLKLDFWHSSFEKRQEP